jgi:hypothetical protein
VAPNNPSTRPLLKAWEEVHLRVDADEADGVPRDAAAESVVALVEFSRPEAVELHAHFDLMIVRLCGRDLRP